MKQLFLLYLCLMIGCQQKTPSNEIITKLNQRFQINLSVSSGTGYSWQMIETKDFQVMDTQIVQDTDKADGQAEKQIFIIAPLKKGEFLLHFNLSRSWEKDSQPVESKIFKVIVN